MTELSVMGVLNVKCLKRNCVGPELSSWQIRKNKAQNKDSKK